MNIDESTVDKIARLAKLTFSGEEKKAMIHDMDRMIAFVSQLDEVDTTSIEPLIHMTEKVNVLRPDVARVAITQEEALRNAPKKDSTYFKIPKVLG